MTWEWVALASVSLASLVTLTWVALPYLRRRSDEEKRLAALEAANVAYGDRIARCEQALEGVGPLAQLRRMGGVSR